MTSIQSENIPNEQQQILGAFNKSKVKYIGFDSFAINYYAPTLPFGDIQLWTKPTAENFEAIRNAIKLATGHNNRLIIRRKTEDFLAHQNANQHFMEIGFSNRKVKIFPIIPGISAAEFEEVLAKANLRKTGFVNSKILNVKDAYKSMAASENRHKEKFLHQLERAFPLEIDKKSNPSKIPFVKKDFNYLIQNLDLEIVLENLGFQLKKDKSGIAQHLWSRNIDDRKIVVFLNKGGTKGYFDVNDAQSKGTVLDLLIKEFNGKWFEVFGFCDKVLTNLELANLSISSPKKDKSISLKILTIDEQTKAREKSIRDAHEILPYQKPQYLNERSISNETIYSPEFLGQINNIPYKKGDLTYYNTAFPMRNEHGLTNFIVRFNNNLNRDADNTSLNKYYLRGEKLDAVWMSNELYKTTNTIEGKHLNHSNPVQIPQNTLGVLHKTEKDGVIKHYFTFKANFLDLITKELLKPKPNATIQFAVRGDNDLEKVKADRIVITESPIDCISFAQIFGKPNEYNLYIATGGHPSPSQIEFINQVVQKHGCEVILAMDNENAGLRFNTNIAGGIQHPLFDSQNDIKFKIDYVNSNQYVAQYNNLDENDPKKTLLKGECHLSLEFSKNQIISKEKIDYHLSKITSYIGSFLNKDTVKVFEAITSENKEIFKIAIPNNKTQLKRTIDVLLNTRSELAGESKQIFILKKPILKDWNDDLMFGKKHIISTNIETPKIEPTIKIKI